MHGDLGRLRLPSAALTADNKSLSDRPANLPKGPSLHQKTWYLPKSIPTILHRTAISTLRFGTLDPQGFAVAPDVRVHVGCERCWYSR